MLLNEFIFYCSDDVIFISSNIAAAAASTSIELKNINHDFFFVGLLLLEGWNKKTKPEISLMPLINNFKHIVLASH